MISSDAKQTVILFGQASLLIKQHAVIMIRKRSDKENAAAASAVTRTCVHKHFAHGQLWKSAKILWFFFACESTYW